MTRVRVSGAGRGFGAARTTVAAVALGLLAAACTPADDAPSTPSPSPTGSAEPAPIGAVELPEHAAGQAAAWVLEQVNAAVGTPVPEADLRFSATFLAQVPAEDLAGVLDQLRVLAPWLPAEVQGDETTLVVLIRGTGQDLDMQLALDVDGLISGLLFTVPEPPREPAASWQELTDEVEAGVGSTSLYVATVDADGRCVPVDGMPVGTAAGAQLPMGSVVKLYVLGAVVDAVGRGDLAWDTALTVSDDLRSLPSGELQDAPAGTVVTVEEAARGMIAISDNTATDLLIDAVGRERVEQAMADMEHSDPAANVPLPTTRELFQIGWGGGEALRTRWRDGDAAARSALLTELPGGPPAIDLAEIGRVAVWPDHVDWFATAEDLCAAHVALAERSQLPQGAVVREILAANPGMEVDRATWPYLAFKGGSSIGTMAGTWYAEGADGAATVVVVQTATPDPQRATSAQTMVGIAQDALRLAAG